VEQRGRRGSKRGIRDRILHVVRTNRQVKKELAERGNDRSHEGSPPNLKTFKGVNWRWQSPRGLFISFLERRALR